MRNNERNSKERNFAKKKTFTEINKNGVKIAVEILGKNPVRDSSKFTNFQQSHGGQWVWYLPFKTSLISESVIHESK